MTDNSPSKAVLVTGAAHRIGRAIALGFARDGWNVAVHFNESADAAASTAAGIRDAGASAALVRGNLARQRSAIDIVAAARDAIGPLTCLVNNASLFENDSLETMTDESWDMHHGVNLRAAVFLAQAFAAQMPAGIGGNIVNIIDQRVWKPTPRFFSYTVAKSALWAATRTMAQALAPAIRVNAIGPGPTCANKRQRPEDFEDQFTAIPLGRAIEPDEIWSGIRFILSAGSMTGQMLALDGGQHLAWETPDVTGANE